MTRVVKDFKQHGYLDPGLQGFWFSIFLKILASDLGQLVSVFRVVCSVYCQRVQCTIDHKVYRACPAA